MLLSPLIMINTQIHAKSDPCEKELHCSIFYLNNILKCELNIMFLDTNKMYYIVNVYYMKLAECQTLSNITLANLDCHH